MTLNKKKSILFVFGTRPEAIKLAPLIKELQNNPQSFYVKICVTGQHRGMLDQVLSLFEIAPEYDLNIMQSGQDLYDITSRVLLAMRNVLDEVKPDLVIVHGDTSSSTAAALASFYKKIPVAHVEAGLRTNNIFSPWPEELNRQITTRISTYHFAPTVVSKNNLLKDGVPQSKIFVTGNTVIDSLHWALQKLESTHDLKSQVLKSLEENGLNNKSIQSWIEKKRKMILITGHRRENFGEGFINICEAIKELANKFHEIDFVYPVHLNPNVRMAIKKVFNKNIGHLISGQNTIFIEPVDYLPFVFLMNLSHLIITDSGGIQEEAPSLGKPVLVMRDTTERPEAVKAGTVKLVGANKIKIIDEVSKLINDESLYLSMSNTKNPYGDGISCKRILNALLELN